MKKILVGFFLGVAVVFSIAAVNSAVNGHRVAYVDGSIVTKTIEYEKILELVEKKSQKYTDDYDVIVKKQGALYKEMGESSKLAKNHPDKWSKEKMDNAQKQIDAYYEEMRQIQVDMEEELPEYESDLLAPLLAKAESLIDEIRKEQGFDYVLNMDAVAKAPDGCDITPILAKKLGVK